MKKAPGEVKHIDLRCMGSGVQRYSYALLVKDDFSSFVFIYPSKLPASESAAEAITMWISAFEEIYLLIFD